MDESMTQKEMDKQFAEMERKVQIHELANRYVDGLGMSEKIAQQYAEARIDGDWNLEAEVLKQYMKSVKADVLKEFIAKRGEVNAGHGAILDDGESSAVRWARTLPRYDTTVNEDLLKPYM